MSMRLFVHIYEARQLKNSDRCWQAYAQLKLGHSKQKSKISPRGSAYPYWHEDFFFNVDDTSALLSIVILGQDRMSNVFLGCVRLSIDDILRAENQSLPPSWYPLQKRHGKSKTPITGELRLSCSVFYGERSLSSVSRHSDASSMSSALEHSNLRTGSGNVSKSDEGDKLSNRTFISMFHRLLYKLVAFFISILSLVLPKVLIAWLSSQVSWLFPFAKEDENHADENLPLDGDDSFIEEEGIIFPSFFEDDGIFSESSVQEMPPPLQGVALSEMYLISAKAMNGLLFGPGSEFQQDLSTLQKRTNLVEGSWTRGDNDLPKRTVTYLKAATKLVPSVKATEGQIYSRADDKGFIVDVYAKTPDVIQGDNFNVHVQHCIFAGPHTPSGDQTCFLRVSWAVEFLRSTWMKVAIEKGARQGLEENYKVFAEVLEKYAKINEGSLSIKAKSFKVVSGTELVEDTDVPSSKSGWGLVIVLRLFLTLSLIVIIFGHIYSVKFHDQSRFEIWRIDLPDSWCEALLPVLLGAQIPSIFRLAKSLLF